MEQWLQSPSFGWGVGLILAADLLIFGGKHLIRQILHREETERMNHHGTNHSEN